MGLLSLSSSLTPSFPSLHLKPKPKLSLTFPNPSFLCSAPTSTPLSSSLKLKPTANSPKLSAPQSPATAMRGAEADAMGLLLRERIVFLGNNIDDFAADAIISQLLLLDAQDPTKDIRLFINSPGGSLRYPLFFFSRILYLFCCPVTLGKDNNAKNTLLLQLLLCSVKLFSLWERKNILVCVLEAKGTLFCKGNVSLDGEGMEDFGERATMAIYDVVQLVRADVSTLGIGIAASTASIILGGGTKGKRFAMPNTRIMIHQPLGGASGQAIDVEIQAREIMHNKNNVTRIISASTGRPFEQVLKDIDRDRYMSPIEAVEYGIIDGVIDRDSIIPLEPVPERVKASLNYEEISKDPRKFLTPDIPDDEIY
ncbi:hypothetical protein CXB51_019788 [Gossypium anomalum]|uniref:ATP-dependent Clp protease proteolytic subunit n=1 Tax=Gossypium anomalum TaxID=47600 RepID=A0A8J6CVV4_9ROSI|nr:hypothetical protein CXB51_019788 [Gossypium anomalum]